MNLRWKFVRYWLNKRGDNKMVYKREVVLTTEEKEILEKAMGILIQISAYEDALDTPDILEVIENHMSEGKIVGNIIDFSYE